MSICLEPVKEDITNTTGMVHLTMDCCPDASYRGLCGAPLRGIDEPARPVDCVVCDELSPEPQTCPFCGCVQ